MSIVIQQRLDSRCTLSKITCGQRYCLLEGNLFLDVTSTQQQLSLIYADNGSQYNDLQCIDIMRPFCSKGDADVCKHAQLGFWQRDTNNTLLSRGK